MNKISHYPVFPTHAQQISLLDPAGDHICQYVSRAEFQNLSDGLKSKPGIMILHVNAAGPRFSLNSLQELVKESSFHPPDVICVF